MLDASLYSFGIVLLVGVHRLDVIGGQGNFPEQETFFGVLVGRASLGDFMGDGGFDPDLWWSSDRE